MTTTERPRTGDHRRKPKPKKVSLASIHEEETFAVCSCGWETAHKRKKVLTRRVDEHVKHKHNNRAIWA